MVMSQIAMELEDRAAELGFQSLQQALDAGCTVEYGSDGNSELVEPLVAAHRAWEKERDDVLENLAHLLNIYKGVKPDEDIIEDAIKFVESCHE